MSIQISIIECNICGCNVSTNGFCFLCGQKPTSNRVAEYDDDCESISSMESHDDYDDCGVLCHYSKTTGGWEPLEEHCIECGHLPDECDCEEYTEAMVQENAKIIARLEEECKSKDREIAALEACIKRKSTEIWFDDNVWSSIKAFAGYSNDYPTDLPYYARMIGQSRNYSMTKMKWKRIRTVEDYIDRLCEKCDDFEEDLMWLFIPKQLPKTKEQMRIEWDQIRIEWDSRHGEGDFDDDVDNFDDDVDNF